MKLINDDGRIPSERPRLPLVEWGLYRNEYHKFEWEGKDSSSYDRLFVIESSAGDFNIHFDLCKMPYKQCVEIVEAAARAIYSDEPYILRRDEYPRYGEPDPNPVYCSPFHSGPMERENQRNEIILPKKFS